MTTLSSTTLSGYVDTSTSRWVGIQSSVDSYNVGGVVQFPSGPYLGGQASGPLPVTDTNSVPTGPANDFAAMATPIEIGRIAMPTNLTAATLETGEPMNPKQ